MFTWLGVISFGLGGDDYNSSSKKAKHVEYDGESC
jgi:hypothetical protein